MISGFLNSQENYIAMSRKIHYPKNFSRFYDIIYDQYISYLDYSFYLDQVKKARGKVLEAGVGTGRFYMDALNQGADIYGLDVSDHMIDVLLGKLNKSQHHRISVQSILDFKYDVKFDLVLAPFRVMMHVLKKEDQIKALNNVYDHLNPGGRFIFDVFVPDLEQILHGIEKLTDFDKEYAPGLKLKRTHSTTPDLINQQILVHFTLEWDEGGQKMREDWETPMRFYFRYELEHLVERSKFEKYKILGDFQGKKLEKDSKEFLVVCTK
jgi:SAM-dependent methyltransferase